MATFTELISGDTPVLVDFTATWCGPCQAQAPVLHDLAAEFGGRLRILKIDVDKNQALAQEQHVKGVPTLVIYRQGKPFWRQSGFQNLASLRAQVNRALQSEAAFSTLYGGR